MNKEQYDTLHLAMRQSLDLIKKFTTDIPLILDKLSKTADKLEKMANSISELSELKNEISALRIEINSIRDEKEA